jgi:hypothetical protein
MLLLPEIILSVALVVCLLLAAFRPGLPLACIGGVALAGPVGGPAGPGPGSPALAICWGAPSGRTRSAWSSA